MKVLRLIALLLITLTFGLGATSFAIPYGEGAYGNCDYGSVNGCSISISTNGTVTLNAMPNDSGVYTIDSDTATVSTSSFNGYTLQIANSSATEPDLISGSNEITAHTGTFASPTVLSANTWGYRIDDSGSFGSGPTSTVTNSASSSLTFAGVPLSGSPDTVKNYTTGAATDDETDIWYGVFVNNSQASGTYTSTVTYTATSNP